MTAEINGFAIEQNSSHRHLFRRVTEPRHEYIFEITSKRIVLRATLPHDVGVDRASSVGFSVSEPPDSGPVLLPAPQYEARKISVPVHKRVQAEMEVKAFAIAKAREIRKRVEAVGELRATSCRRCIACRHKPARPAPATAEVLISDSEQFARNLGTIWLKYGCSGQQSLSQMRCPMINLKTADSSLASALF
jgi:hypothetical protein